MNRGVADPPQHVEALGDLVADDAALFEHTKHIELGRLRVAVDQSGASRGMPSERLGELAERHQRQARIDGKRPLGHRREPEVERAVRREEAEAGCR